MQNTIKIFFTTLACTAGVSADVLTFEDLPAPTINPAGHGPVLIEPLPLSYGGFDWSSEETWTIPGVPYNDHWSYYQRPSTDYYGFSAGVIGDQALTSYYGAWYTAMFTIARSEPWVFDGAFITGHASLFYNPTPIIHIVGYLGTEQIFHHEQAFSALAMTWIAPSAATVDRLHIYDPELRTIMIDNFTFHSVPAPPALGLLTLAAFVGSRKRK